MPCPGRESTFLINPPPAAPLLPFLFTLFPGRPPLQDVAAATKTSFSAEGTEDSEPDFHVEVKGSALEVRLFVLVVSAVTLALPTTCAVHGCTGVHTANTTVGGHWHC